MYMAVLVFGIFQGKKLKFHLFYTCFIYVTANPAAIYDYVYV